VLPILWIAGDALGKLVGRRVPVLTASRLLTHQTFRELYRTGVLDINQRFRITNLTFLFTDLKGSTELYERVGDLAAFDLVRAHFHALTEIVSDEDGAVVKTIGDAIMATFPTPAHGIAAALKMRDAMKALNDRRGSQDMLLKIGLHAGACLAVMLNEQQDYFGQTVNIASRVQRLSRIDNILLTGAIFQDIEADALMQDRGLRITHASAALRGVGEEVSIYEIS
jgi:class 3 adenylate cyclase